MPTHGGGGGGGWVVLVPFVDFSVQGVMIEECASPHIHDPRHTNNIPHHHRLTLVGTSGTARHGTLS